MRKFLLFSLLVPVLIIAGCGTTSNNGAPSTNSSTNSTTANASAPLLAVVSPALEGPCTVSDQYKRGDPVVFRIQIVDPATGNSLDNRELSGVSIVLPNNQSLIAQYRTHEGSTQKFWVAHWIVPHNYPTGLVKYNVKVDGSSRTVKRVQFEVPNRNAHLTIVS